MHRRDFHSSVRHHRVARKEPLVDLRLFARRNFGLGSIVNLALGIGLYGVIFILPLYWDRFMGTMRPRSERSSSGLAFRNSSSSPSFQS